MFLYRVSVVLDYCPHANEQCRFEIKITQCKAEEKKLTFLVYDRYDKNIKKMNLNKLETDTHTLAYNSISYHLYTEEDGIENAKTLLLEKVKSELGKRKEAILSLEKTYINGFKETFIHWED